MIWLHSATQESGEKWSQPHQEEPHAHRPASTTWLRDDPDHASGGQESFCGLRVILFGTAEERDFQISKLRENDTEKGEEENVNIRKKEKTLL